MMRNLLFLSFIALALSLSLTQSSYAECQLDGPNGGGNIISCPQPLQITPLNGGSTPNTTDDDDIVTIPNPGGLQFDSPFFVPMIDTQDGEDQVTVEGRIENTGVGGDTGAALFTGEDADEVIVNTGANIIGGLGAGIATWTGADSVTINGGSVTGANFGAAIATFGTFFVIFPDIAPVSFTMNGGSIDTNGPIVYFGGFGTDIVTINGGTVVNGNIFTDTGFDSVLITGGTFSGDGIDTFFGINTIHVAADVPNIGLLDCGTGGVIAGPDTLIFSQTVPEPEVAQLTADFLAAGDDGSLEINGITYDWLDCENRVPNFNGVITTLTLAPLTDVNDVGDDHTVTATLLAGEDPVVGVEVDFLVLQGPNQGLSGIGITDANGEATFTYTSDTIGTDVIRATYDDPSFGLLVSNGSTKTWILPPRNVPTLSEWGLISMAAILGIVGFMVIRRRQLAA